jgi:hypothetical protein
MPTKNLTETLGPCIPTALRHSICAFLALSVLSSALHSASLNLRLTQKGVQSFSAREEDSDFPSMRKCESILKGESQNVSGAARTRWIWGLLCCRRTWGSALRFLSYRIISNHFLIEYPCMN